jgi:hypothetical protein
MPTGFFTIEQWRGGQWRTVCHLDARTKPTEAYRELEKRGRAGFFRIVQTQRVIWAEKTGRKLKLRKWHAMDPKTLERSVKAFDRDRGKWPVKSSRP